MMVESPIFDIVPICEPWCWNIYQHLPNINCPVIGRLYQHHGAYGVYRLPIWMVNVVRDPIPRHWKPMEWAEKTPAGWWAGAMCKWVGVDFWSTKMMTVSMNMTKNMNMDMNMMMMMMNANMNMMNVNMKMLMMMMMMVYFWRYRWFAHLRLPKCQKQLSRDVFCFSAWTMSEKVLRPHLIMAYPVPSAWRLSEDSKILPLWKPKLAGKSPFLLKLAGNLDSCKKHELSSSIFRKKWSTRGYLSTPPCVFRDGELATRRD